MGWRRKELCEPNSKVHKGQEATLYTGDAPLLRLLNSISKNVAKERQQVLVFRVGNKCQVKHPFADQDRHPDIIVQWEQSDAFQEIDYTEDESFDKIWTELATVGEVKVAGRAASQLAGYLQNHLRFHPELNAALGFSVWSTGYALFYHDAAVDIWRSQDRYFFAGLLLKRAHEDKPLCGLVQASSHGYVLDETGTPIRTTRFNPKSGTEEARGRFKMRTVTSEIGQPLEGVHSLHKFLCAMYDACAVQRNLYRKCKIMHRDISDKNIMFAPDTDAYRERNREGYAEVKFVNQVLAKDESAKPAPQCLMVDLGNGADLGVEHGLDALTERIGTPKFIARSVSSGEVLSVKAFSSAGVELAQIEGVLTDCYQFMHTTEYQAEVGDSPSSTPPETTLAEAKFAHQLFHDAESTFWVIAWTLARSIKTGSEQEKEPYIKFSQFFYTMSTHYPMPAGNDTRQFFHHHVTTEDWESILHPDLAILATMLANMFEYIRPEWAHRPDLDAEHVHEALMRLLLIEIVKIKNSTNIDIHIGGRDSPPPPPGADRLPSSITSSHTKSLALSQASGSMGLQPSGMGGAGSGSVGSSKRKLETLSATSETSGPSKRVRANTSDGPASRTRSAVAPPPPPPPAPTAPPQEQESNLVWPSGPCKLQKPKSHGEVLPASDQSPE